MSNQAKLRKCYFCRKLCTRDYLHRHMRDHTTEVPYKCQECLKLFKGHTELYRHRESAHPNKINLNCEYCSKKYKSLSQINKHYRYSHKNIKFQCVICKKKFASKFKLNLHARHHNVWIKQCYFCNKKFKKHCILSVHIVVHTKEKIFKCSECSTSCARMEHLNTHKLIHNPPPRLIECKYCSKRFQYQHTLDSHIRTQHKPKRFSCDICSKLFSTKRELTWHTWNHLNVRNFKCGFCDKTFITNGDLNSHLKQVHVREKPFTCYFCGSKSLTFTRHQTHFADHTMERPYKCKICKHESKTKENFTQHNRNIHSTSKSLHYCLICKKGYKHIYRLNQHNKAIHSKQLLFKCMFCEKLFAIRSQLNRHLKSHTGEKAYNCQFCNKKFETTANLSKHKKTAHLNWKSSTETLASEQQAETLQDSGPKYNKLSCTKCDQIFWTTSKLNLHEAHNHGKYDCYFCKKNFTMFGRLSVHMTVHTREKRFKCLQCNSRFANSNTLTGHQNTHTKDQPRTIPCNLCPQMFRFRAALKSHFYNYHPKKKHSCYFCNKLFNGKTTLNFHLNAVHLNLKPFKCVFCNKCFISNASRSDHINRMHTKEKSFRCYFCELYFVDFTGLKNHITNHTQELPFKCKLCCESFKCCSTLCHHIKMIHLKSKLKITLTRIT